MTDRIEKEAEDYINKIDSFGGTIAAIENGYIQSEIQEAAYRFEKELESGKKIVVGVNKFQTDGDPKPELLKINIEMQKVAI